LGFAVVPDVARMNAGSFASIRTTSPRWLAPSARNSGHQTSRPPWNGTGSRPRFRITTCSTGAPLCASASSTISLRRVSFPLRKVTSAVNTAFEPLAAIRSPSAFAPNPAKTTQWIAPIRTVASMRAIASGEVGM
jgi:hypothetical protein